MYSSSQKGRLLDYVTCLGHKSRQNIQIPGNFWSSPKLKRAKMLPQNRLLVKPGLINIHCHFLALFKLSFVKNDKIK